MCTVDALCRPQLPGLSCQSLMVPFRKVEADRSPRPDLLSGLDSLCSLSGHAQGLRGILDNTSGVPPEPRSLPVVRKGLWGLGLCGALGPATIGAVAVGPSTFQRGLDRWVAPSASDWNMWVTPPHLHLALRCLRSLLSKICLRWTVLRLSQ